MEGSGFFGFAGLGALFVLVLLGFFSCFSCSQGTPINKGIVAGQSAEVSSGTCAQNGT